MAFDIALRSFGTGFDIALGDPASSGPVPLVVDVELLEGASTIATWSDVAVTSLWTDLNLTVTSIQAATITNFADLRVRITATGDEEQVRVSEINLEMLQIATDTYIVRRSYGGGVSYSPGGQF